MFCQICKKEQATVQQLEKHEDGEWAYCQMCEKCALAAEAGSSATHPVGKMLIEGAKKKAAASKSTPGDAFACPGCGLAYAIFSKQRRLGCGLCYDSFRSDVEQIFRRVQQHTNHRGKVPGRPQREVRPSAELDELRSKLQRAIEEERFEDAALFRDKMRRLTEGGGA